MRYGILRPRIIGAVAIVMVAVLVGIAGYNAYRQAFGTIRAQHSAELQVIGKLKVDQIVDWRAERLADAHVGAEGIVTGAAVAGWLADPTGAALRADLIARLDLLTHQDPGPAAQLSQYDDAILAAPDGHLLLSLDPVATELDPEAQSLAAQVAASQEPAMGDFVRVESSGHVYIDVAAPILDASGRPIAVLILRSDPSLHLYPLIQSWPTPSESAETLLVRRDGASVLFLNVLRHRDDPALTIREPLSSTGVPAVAAVLGRVGEFEGTDYRGAAVLADLRPVPDSPWFLVSKVDTAEILAEVGDRGRAILLLCLLAVVLAGGAVAIVLSVRQISLQQRLLRSERDRASVARLHERVLALARDIFLLTDPSNRIVEANAAAAAYGYSREELLQLNAADLRTPETRATLERDWQAAEGADGVLFETVHMRKDGSTFPVEVSSRVIDVDGMQHRESFVRDITERRAAEAQLRAAAEESARLLEAEVSSRRALLGILEDQRATEAALRESEERFRRAVVDSPFPILLHAEDGQVLQVSRSWCEITGYAPEELTTTAAWTELAYGERRDVVLAEIDRLYELGHRIAEGDYQVRTRSGEVRTWEFSSAPLGRLAAWPTGGAWSSAWPRTSRSTGAPRPSFAGARAAIATWSCTPRWPSSSIGTTTWRSPTTPASGSSARNAKRSCSGSRPSSCSIPTTTRGLASASTACATLGRSWSPSRSTSSASTVACWTWRSRRHRSRTPARGPSTWCSSTSPSASGPRQRSTS